MELQETFPSYQKYYDSLRATPMQWKKNSDRRLKLNHFVPEDPIRQLLKKNKPKLL